MKKQISLYESGNELAAMAAKQINYHVMGYYPITPSTQIAENLDLMKAQGLHDISLIAAEGEHSAAGICYGASTGGGRVFNATSANAGAAAGSVGHPVSDGHERRLPHGVRTAVDQGRSQRYHDDAELRLDYSVRQQRANGLRLQSDRTEAG